MTRCLSTHRAKKTEEIKAKGPTPKSSAPSKSIEDISKAKGKAPTKATSSSQEGLDKTKRKTTVPAKAKSASQEGLDQGKRSGVTPSPATAPSITAATLISHTSSSGGSMSVSEMTGRSKKKPDATQSKQAAQ